jgi:hypothetical protein
MAVNRSELNCATHNPVIEGRCVLQQSDRSGPSQLRHPRSRHTPGNRRATRSRRQGLGRPLAAWTCGNSPRLPACTMQGCLHVRLREWLGFAAHKTEQLALPSNLNSLQCQSSKKLNWRGAARGRPTLLSLGLGQLVKPEHKLVCGSRASLKRSHNNGGCSVRGDGRARAVPFTALGDRARRACAGGLDSVARKGAWGGGATSPLHISMRALSTPGVRTITCTASPSSPP